MRSMFGLVLVAGIGLAGTAVYLAKGYIGQTESALQSQQELLEKLGPITQIFVLKNPKNYGEPLLPEDVELVYWPTNSLPEGAFDDQAALFPETAEGANSQRYILRQMEAREPLLAVKVTAPGEPAGLTGQLAKGMRAFAIRVDVESGVSGFVQPGDNVDIYWTGVADGLSAELTRLIEGSVGIIAVDQQADAMAGATVARTVTVAATPEQVARLAQAQATGRLALSLVGQNDDSIAGMIEVDSKGLLGMVEEQAEVVQVEEVKRCTVRQRMGGQVTEVEIPCTN